MNIVINDTNYKIKYGYLVVSKSEIIPKVVETMNGLSDASADYGFITRLMETVADMLLYGLQKAHADEFGCNFITKEGYEEKYIEKREQYSEMPRCSDAHSRDTGRHVSRSRSGIGDSP